MNPNLPYSMGIATNINAVISLEKEKVSIPNVLGILTRVSSYIEK